MLCKALLSWVGCGVGLHSGVCATCLAVGSGNSTEVEEDKVAGGEGSSELSPKGVGR